MNISLVSERYAKALLMYSEDNGDTNVVYSELSTLAAAFFSVKQMKHVIDSPIITIDQRKELIFTASGNKKSKSLVRFVDVLTENERLSCIHEIALKFCEMYRHLHNIHHCVLTTATAIGDDEMNHITSIIERFITDDGVVELQNHVDDSLIGGFILEVDSKSLDRSISHELQRMNRDLVDKYQRIS